MSFDLLLPPVPPTSPTRQVPAYIISDQLVAIVKTSFHLVNLSPASDQVLLGLHNENRCTCLIFFGLRRSPPPTQGVVAPRLRLVCGQISSSPQNSMFSDLI